MGKPCPARGCSPAKTPPGTSCPARGCSPGKTPLGTFPKGRGRSRSCCLPWQGDRVVTGVAGTQLPGWRRFYLLPLTLGCWRSFPEPSPCSRPGGISGLSPTGVGMWQGLSRSWFWGGFTSVLCLCSPVSGVHLSLPVSPCQSCPLCAVPQPCPSPVTVPGLWLRAVCVHCVHLSRLLTPMATPMATPIPTPVATRAPSQPSLLQLLRGLLRVPWWAQKPRVEEFGGS